MLRFFFFVALSFLLSLCSCDVPVYLWRYCSDSTFHTSNYTTYKSNFYTLLSSLSSNATSNYNNIYSNATVGRSSNAVYGLYYCRGDVTHDVCRDCALTAVQEMSQLCPSEEYGYICYDQCMFRYSNQPFFSILSETPLYYMSNKDNISDDATRFNILVNHTMTKAAIEATSDSMRFATREAYFTQNQTLYCLVQCSLDLSENDCGTCLSDAIADLPSCCTDSKGGRVVNPSCNIRYEIYPFYGVTASAPSPSPTLSPSNTTTSPSPPSSLLAPPHQSNTNSTTVPGKGQSSRKIVVIVAPVAAAGVILFSVLLYCLLTRKKKQDQDTSEENGGSTIKSAESLLFDFNTILAATNNFADANKIGHGGFGGVFKGILPNGQEIAVKRLSSENSGQGEEEFKNEVLLVAKLQHRNLVRLLGFCLEGEERILIYELVHNKSLDYFLFDPEKCVMLDWGSRYKIIGGIARGILYLHEDSRLRIIHRDLKASNILLDGEMNPQISDFGTARIFEKDQTRANTNRIIGTWGYMPPEYVMYGDFSVKSDVFSFGALVLEIVSGKRNGNYLYQEDSVQDLRSYAWRHWFAGTAFEFVDPVMRETCSRTEVMRCIHIGLLCVQEDVADRPTMASVVLMLKGSVTLPLPSQPIFLKERKEMQEAESDQSKSSKFTPSLNNTGLEPR